VLGAPLSETRSFAVIALFPTSDPIYEVSIKNLITGFQNNGLKVVVILNTNANESLNQYFQASKCVVITRKNQGRDFGAYKAGILWLDNEIGLSNINRLVLANDTLLWINSAEQIIAETLLSDWSSLFLNLELKTHAQSFFLSFSNQVLSEPKFIDFWLKYVPLNYRRHAILFGEIKLSELLLKRGYSCKPYVTAARITPQFLDLPDEILRFSALGNLPISEMGGIPVPGVNRGRKQPSEEVKLFMGMEELLEEYEIGEIELKKAMIRLIGQYCNSHAPHRIGMHLYLSLGMPMKTDMYKCYPLSEIYHCVQWRNPEHAGLVLDYFSKKSQNFMEGSKENERRRILSEI
jgi:hypothetical protein